jgi:dolichyl-diphosphooligosaccharide--protein glycosyltransferase
MDVVKTALTWAVRLAVLAFICYSAVYIRLDAVITYGRVIHEFDPWFNFRATQYLVDHGYQKFSTWYDEEVW